MMRNVLLGGCLVVLLTVSGCAPVIVGGAATGVYKVGSDERTAGTMLDDSAITTKITLKLIEDPMIKSYKIDVDTLEGTVFLTGVVETAQEAERALGIAGSVEGVKGVVDNMQIGVKSITQALADKQTGVKIKAKLIGEPGIRSWNVDVDVDLGVVTLTGKMDTQANKDRVIEIARTTAGTIKVIDNLRVKAARP
ncbi:MAG: BON domain-containing protein [Desulfobacterales bacterium]|nr:BON domain-containing protein [Desulfobacterales bacterium]